MTVGFWDQEKACATGKEVFQQVPGLGIEQAIHQDQNSGLSLHLNHTGFRSLLKCLLGQRELSPRHLPCKSKSNLLVL